MLRVFIIAIVYAIVASPSVAAPSLFNSTLADSSRAQLLDARHITSSDKSFYSALSLNIQALNEIKEKDEIIINLPDGEERSTVKKIYSGANGAKHVILQSIVYGFPISSVITIGKQNVFMELSTEDGIYAAAGTKTEILLHKPSELFQAQGIMCEGGIEVDYSQSSIEQTKKQSNEITQGQSESPTDKTYDSANSAGYDYGDTAFFDILIVYSSNAKNIAGDINAKIDHYFAYTNEAFAASGIHAQLKFAGAMEVDYADTFSGNALDDIIYGNAPLDGVAARRIEVGADSVAFLIPSFEGDGIGGIARMPAHLTPEQSYEHMFFTQDIDRGGFTFAHEFGHNLGLGHSRQQGEVGADFDHGVGYQMSVPPIAGEAGSGRGFKTLMSYGGGYTPTIPIYSNPSNMCVGLPCGLSKEDKDFGADAVSAVNAVRHIVAAYSEGADQLNEVQDALAKVVDPNLKQCLTNIAYAKRYAKNFSELSCGSPVYSLDGIESFRFIDTLILNNLQTEDLSPLSHLKYLTTLYLTTSAKDFSFLASLTQLQDLYIGGIGSFLNSSFDDTQATYLQSLSSLQRLSISSGLLNELPDLSMLTFLNEVWLTNTATAVLSALKQNSMLSSIRVRPADGETIDLPDSFNWPLLEIFDVSQLNIQEFSRLSSLAQLRELTLRESTLTNLSGIENFSALEALDVSGSLIDDISHLSALKNFNTLEVLDISENPIDDMSPLRALTNLRSLNIQRINTGDVSPLINLSNLESFQAGSFGYAPDWAIIQHDWSVIQNMTKLERLSLIGVDGYDLPYIAATRKNLTSLSLYDVDTPDISDISSLFQHYRLKSLDISLPNYAFREGTGFYCWQAEFVETLLLSGEILNPRCNPSDDQNDFDGDNISNEEELSIGTNPVENDNVSPTIEFSVGDITIYEEYENKSEYIGVIRRTGNTENEATVLLDVDDDTPDYQSSRFSVSPKLVTFSRGQHYANFIIRIIDDSYIDNTEIYSITLTEPVGVQLGEKDTLTVNVIDITDDTWIDKYSTPPIGWEKRFTSVDESEVKKTIVLNRPVGLDGPFTVDVSGIALTQNAIDGFRIDNSRLDFTSDDEFKPVELILVDDDNYTGSKFIAIRLINPVLSWVDPAYASLIVEVTDDENQVATAYDYDGDGNADIAIRRPELGYQFIKRSSDNVIDRLFFGSQTTDIPVSGDFDGDGRSDIAVYRSSIGSWLIKQSSNEQIFRLVFGNQPSDVPVPADYDGDGLTDIAVYRKSTGQWIIRPSATPNSYRRITFGTRSEDIAVPADYDGDGKVDIAVRRPSTGQFIVRQSSNAQITRTFFGSEITDIPVPADYDGDGIADLAVRRPDIGYWFIRYSSSNQIYRSYFGSQPTDIPVPADYDGDGLTDIAVRRPDYGNWFVRYSGSNEMYRIFFGSQSTDIPLASPLSDRLSVKDSYTSEIDVDEGEGLSLDYWEINEGALKLEVMPDSEAEAMGIIRSTGADLLGVSKEDFGEMQSLRQSQLK